MTGPQQFALGRRLNHDPRSREFPFAARADVPIRTVRWTRRAPIFDQGTLGSCTGQAAAGWLGTDDKQVAGRADITRELAEGIYSEATQIDPFDGQWPPEDTGSDGTSVAMVLLRRGLISKFTHCFSFVDVLAALQDGPIITGTNWYQGMFDPGPRGLVSISGSVAGGHEYVIVGVDTDRRELVFANSWGAGWGEHGFFRMGYDTYRRLLGEQGDATVLHAPVPAVPFGPVAPWWQRWFGWFFRLFGASAS